MSFIQRELDRISALLREPLPADRFCQLYAVQQALSWALEPEGFALPSAVVTEGRAIPLTWGTQEAPRGC